MTRAPLTLQAHDGYPLAAWCHQPAEPACACVVIAPAMAVPQTFYSDFAAFLASQGYRVWTFDYRCMGESARGPMRSCKADITDWIAKDLDAVVRHASAGPDGLPLFILGHSLGGQATPLLPSILRVSGLVNIAVGSGAVRHNQPRLRRTAPFLWRVLAPLLCALFGYFPGRRIGVIGDIPRGVMMQWRRWCLSPDYLLTGEPGAREAYARARYPVLGLTFIDDELLHESGSKMIHEAYTGTAVDYRLLDAAQFDLARIGHFGFFKKHSQDMLWTLVSDWLRERCRESRPAAQSSLHACSIPSAHAPAPPRPAEISGR